MASHPTPSSAIKQPISLTLDDTSSTSDNNSTQNTMTTDCSIITNSNTTNKYQSWLHIQQTLKGHEGYATSQRILHNMTYNKQTNNIQCQCGATLWNGIGAKKLELTRHLNTSIHKLNTNTINNSNNSNNITNNNNSHPHNQQQQQQYNEMLQQLLNLQQNQNNNINIGNNKNTVNTNNCINNMMQNVPNMNQQVVTLQQLQQLIQPRNNNELVVPNITNLTNIQPLQPQHIPQIQFNKQMSSWADKFGAKVTEWANDLNNRVTKIEKDLKWINNKLKEQTNLTDNLEKLKVKKWLKDSVKLEQYFDVFMENGMENMDVIKLVTKKELNEMKIDKLGHRMKILNEISKLNEMDKSIDKYIQNGNSQKRLIMDLADINGDHSNNYKQPPSKRQKLNE